MFLPKFFKNWLVKQNEILQKPHFSLYRMPNSIISYSIHIFIKLQLCVFFWESCHLYQLNSHLTKGTHPHLTSWHWRLQSGVPKLTLSHIRNKFCLSGNPRVFWYIWNHPICPQYPGFVTHFRFTADEKFHPRKNFMSPSKAPLDFSGGPLKHFWNSRLASARKIHLRGFWH